MLNIVVKEKKFTNRIDLPNRSDLQNPFKSEVVWTA